MSAGADRQRLEELLLDRATQGLLPAEQSDLQRLAAEYPEVDSDGFDLAAAAVHLTSPAVAVPMPAAIEARIHRRVAEVFGIEDETPSTEVSRSEGKERGSRSVPATVPPTTTRRHSSVWGRPAWGWLAAAAGFALAALAWWPQLQPRLQGGGSAEVTAEVPTATIAGDPDPARQGAQLLGGDERIASEPDALRLPWTATEDVAAVGATGEVLWSTELQAGILRIEGLAVNDPTVAQYQLWIFDEGQDERFPINGGVFDVDQERVSIAIDAKIQVRGPLLFAVTVEKPGGVVVSSRERIVLLAQTV